MRRLPSAGAGQNRNRPMASLVGGHVAYDAADQFSQDMGGWSPFLGSPDIDGNPYRDIIVSRIRDLVRNDGWASGAVTRVVDTVIGGGLRMVPKPNIRALSYFAPGFDAVWAAEFAQAVEAWWTLYAGDIGLWCDLSRQSNLVRLLRLGFRHKIVDGDAIAVMHWLPDQVGPGMAQFATCVQIMDPDRLSNPNNQADQRYLRGGVEINDNSAALAYHFRRAHQSNWYEQDKALTWTRTPREVNPVDHPGASDAWGRPIVVHDFDADRTGQHRSPGGILKPVLGRLKMLARYDSVELQAAVINSILAAYIESPFDHSLLSEALTDGDQSSVNDIKSYQDGRASFHDERNVSMLGARIPTLYPGEKIGVVSAARPSGEFQHFEAAMLRNVASAVGISEAQISQDWSRTNYSSARAALLEAYKSLGRMRTDYAAAFCTPIYSCWLQEAMERGMLPLPKGAPAFMAARTAYAGCRWMGPGRGWVDPMKERQGAILGLDAGFSTMEDECAEQGRDWKETLQQRAAEIKFMKELGLDLPDWTGGQPAYEIVQPHQAS